MNYYYVQNHLKKFENVKFDLEKKDYNKLKISHLKNRKIVIIKFEKIIKIKFYYDEYYGNISSKILIYDQNEERYLGNKHFINIKGVNYGFYDAKIKLTKYRTFARDIIGDIINVRKKHRFYKCEYNICKMFRRFEKSDFKYMILKLRTAKSFSFYWRELKKKWDDDFLKENLWARQILIDFMCRFAKLHLLYKNKKRKWIIDSTEWFYFKGFKFTHNIKTHSKYKQNYPVFLNENESQINNQRIEINSFYEKKWLFIGWKNKVKEFVKFFEKEECILCCQPISLREEINPLVIYKCTNPDNFVYYLMNSMQSNDERCRFLVIKTNIKIIYQLFINNFDYFLNTGYHIDRKIKTIREIIKACRSENLKYPKYLKRKIILNCQKILLEYL